MLFLMIETEEAHNVLVLKIGRGVFLFYIRLPSPTLANGKHLHPLRKLRILHREPVQIRKGNEDSVQNFHSPPGYVRWDIYSRDCVRQQQ
jgi:hypothetical protein